MHKLAALALLLACPAFADEILFTKGNWTLVMYEFDDGTISCATEGINAEGTVFRYESWPTGIAAVSLSDPDWQFPHESVDETFGLRVNGGELWVGQASKFDSTVQATLPAEDATLNILIDQLLSGTALEVESAKGTPVTHFSLADAAATLQNHFQCEDRFVGI